MLQIQLLCFSLCVYLHLASGGGDGAKSLTSNESAFCSCKIACMDQNSYSTPLPAGVPSTFYFDSGLNSCVKLPSLCKVDAGCTYTAQSSCEETCVARAKSKGSMKAKSKEEDQKGHMDKAEAPNNPSHSSHDSSGRSVRWDLVVGGTCVMVVLVAVLSIVGVVTYNYRAKKKERVRSRYIHDVMEMYDSTSDSSLSENEESSPHKTDLASSRPFIQL